MLTSGLVLIICSLVAYIIINRMRHRRELRTVVDGITGLAGQENPSMLYHQTNDEALKALLVEINHLIQAIQENRVAYMQHEMAMKKMLTNISHDLRTPLTVVLGLTERVLKDPDMTEEEKARYLQLIQVKAQDIIHLINRFFELVRLESDDVEMTLEPLDATELCRKSVLGFYQQVEAEDIRMTLELPEHPILVMADQNALSRVLQNLLSNAIRHGSDGSEIGMSLEIDTDAAYIEVWDRGRGIDEAYQRQVFDRLYTGGAAGQSGQGTGLGLAITRRLVEKMEGNIDIASTPYEKTGITVKLKRYQTY